MDLDHSFCNRCNFPWICWRSFFFQRVLWQHGRKTQGDDCIRTLFEPRILESWSSTTDKFFGEGFVLTGNVTEFLDPVFSSGVTLATVSSQIAAHLSIRHLRGESVDWDKEYTQPMMQG